VINLEEKDKNNYFDFEVLRLPVSPGYATAGTVPLTVAGN
jgi:hypothetical protein